MTLAQWSGLAFKIVVTLWLVAVSVWDRLERRVPNWLVLPVMGAAFMWRVYTSIIQASANDIFSVLLAWLVIFTIWRANVFGGGDAKLLMGLFALFPTMRFLILLSLVVVVVSAPLVVYRRIVRSRPPHDADEPSQKRSLLPTADELRTRGEPNCWAFALPGVIYVWCVF